MASASASDAGSSDIGKLVLRVALGVLILLHGIAKIKGGPGFILDVVGKAGLPAPIAYLVYIGEVVAPVLLIIGLFTRVAALVVAINMLFALGLVHASQLFMLNQQGGWQLELQGMYLFTAVAIALMGAGRLSVGGVAGRWN
jgi:putative oxidoreductase